MMTAIQESRIAERSYQIWEREGKPEGKHLQHWFTAITELEAEAVPKKTAGKTKKSSATRGRKTASPKTRKPTTGKA